MDHKQTLQSELGRHIRMHRKLLGLSQEQLAELSELHPTFISNIERGKVSASLFSIYKIADALRIKVADLVSFIATRDGDIGLENDLNLISAKIRQLDENKRKIYLEAIKGMLVAS